MSTIRTLQPRVASVIAGVMLISLVGLAEAQTISGTVYRDYNGDAAQNAGEPGVAGLTVTAYNTAGQTDQSTTGNDGTYTLTTGSGPFRIEVTNLPAYLKPGAAGRTTVTFAAGGDAGVDLGLHNPSQYCQANPRLSTPCYENGTGAGNTNPGLVSFEYNNIGLPTGYGDGTGSAPLPREDAQIQELVGAWGGAYQRDEQRLFLAAFLKRHTGFKDGPGYVYIFDYATAGVPLAGSFNLHGLGAPAIDLGSVCRRSTTDGDPDSNCDPLGTGLASDYTLPSGTTPNVDLDAFGKVGKISFGDIDLDEAGDHLWLVNLFQRSLIRVDVTGATGSLPGPIQHTLLGGLSVGGSTFDGLCPNGVMRPWALEFNDGVGYLGAVCDASGSQSTADLDGYVFTFNPANPAAGLTQALQIDFDYGREPGQRPGPVFLWQFWANTWAEAAPGTNASDNNYMAPQPIVADLDITEDGSMFISVMDRFGHQNGRANLEAISGATGPPYYDTNAVGDVLHACNVGGTLVLEGGAGCAEGDTQTLDILRDDDGPSGTGEYYWEEYFVEDAGTLVIHGEISTGASALKFGTGEVLSTVIDPIWGNNNTNTQGIVWYDTATGARAEVGGVDHAYMVVDRSPAIPGTFAKGNGLGDLELLCDATPLEVGNRAWCDDDSNGIQDPGESGVGDGTTVTLVCDVNGDGFGGADDLTATTSTSSGHYLFRDGMEGVAAWPGGMIPRATACRLLIDPTDPNLGCSNLTVTVQDGGGLDPGGDLRDSDAIEIGPDAGIAFVSGASGENNHSYDIGFGFSGGSLPVALAGFSAERLGARAVALTWQTHGETDNAGFRVEYARGGEAWQAAGFVEGQGTTPQHHAYRYVLDQLVPGIYRFRLKQIDVDGTFAYSPVVETVLELPGEYLFEPAFPNPFNPVTHLRFAVAERQPLTLALYDLAGRQVQVLYTGTPVAGALETVRLDASQLPSGTYVVRLTGRDFTATQMITLMK